MSSVLLTTEDGEKRLDPNAERPQIAAHRELPLFHFGLRQLLLFVAVVCLLLTTLVSTNGVAALVLLVATAVISMHVLATAIGTHLRSRTDAQVPHKLSESRSVVPAAPSNDASARTSPRSPWHGRGSTDLPWLPPFIIAAMVAGGCAGAVLLSTAIGHRVSTGGVAVGATSFAVLGGWLAFLIGNFYGVFRHGFREALAEQQKDEPKLPQSK